MNHNLYKTDLSVFKTFVPIQTKDNFFMFVNQNDQYIGRSLLYTGEWEPYISTILKQKIKEGMTVVDIGANIGAHTILCSKLVGESGKVIAFEPCKK